MLSLQDVEQLKADQCTLERKRLVNRGKSFDEALAHALREFAISKYIEIEDIEFRPMADNHWRKRLETIVTSTIEAEIDPTIFQLISTFMEEFVHHSQSVSRLTHVPLPALLRSGRLNPFEDFCLRRKNRLIGFKHQLFENRFRHLMCEASRNIPNAERPLYMNDRFVRKRALFARIAIKEQIERLPWAEIVVR